MSFWAEDPELFLYKGKDGVVHVLRCKKETTASSSSSMLMKPEDFTDEGVVTDIQSLTGDSYDWSRKKYEALIDYIYPRNLLVNCHGSVIVELERDQKNKKAAEVVYMRVLDIVDMGCYGPGPDHPGRAVPVRTVKYLQDGTVVQTEPTPKEMNLTQDLAIKSKQLETLQQELQAKELKFTQDQAVKSKQIETLQQELQAKELKFTQDLAIKSKQVETLQQGLAKEKAEMEIWIKRVADLKESAKNKICCGTMNTPLPGLRIYTKTNTRFSLSIRSGEVIFRPNDKSDVCQYWIKDHKYGASVRDASGYHTYALVNKFTGQALKPTNGEWLISPELVRYNPDVLDKSILWSEVDLGDGYRAIRKATDPGLTLDASLEKKGAVFDGSIAHVHKWWGGDNQKWNIAPHA